MAAEMAVETQKIDKLERIACLYLTFLNYSKGISFSRLKKSMPYAYAGDPETSRRKFERDKEELKKLGMELRYIHNREGGREQSEEGVYVPAEAIQNLPDIKMSGDEMRSLAALLLRGIADPERDPHEVHLLRSVATRLFYKDPTYMENDLKPSPAFKIEEKKRTEDSLAVIHSALLRRQIIHIDYIDSKGEQSSRMLAGRGLISHRSRWCLIAYCHASEAIRSFYVDRIHSCRATARSYAADPHFNIKDWSLHPFALPIHPARPVALRLNPDHEETFADYLAPVAKLLALRQSDSHFAFQISNAVALFSWMITYPEAIERLGPPPLLKDFQDHLQKMKQLYRSALSKEKINSR